MSKEKKKVYLTKEEQKQLEFYVQKAKSALSLTELRMYRGLADGIIAKGRFRGNINSNSSKEKNKIRLTKEEQNSLEFYIQKFYSAVTLTEKKEYRRLADGIIARGRLRDNKVN